MVIVVILSSIFITLFEVSLREITLFQNICLLIVVVNILYWFGRYKQAFFIGFSAGILTDLMVQNRFGETVIALFIPLLILSFFDNLLQVEGRGSRIMLIVVGTSFSIVILDFLLKLLFWEGNLEPALVVQRIIVTGVLGIIISVLFGRLIESEQKEGKYL